MSNKFLNRGISVFAIGCLLGLANCNSGSNESIPVETKADSAATNISVPTTTSIKPDSTTAPKKEVAESSDRKSETKIVTIENMKFNPAIITVKKGDKITFINNDIVAHNATEKNNSWASPLLANGKSWTFSPEKNSDYYCTVHVVMKGKIIVE